MAQLVKESACNMGILGSIPGLGRAPGGGHGNPPQCSCLENPHGQRSLVGCSPWGRKLARWTRFSFKNMIKTHGGWKFRSSIFGFPNSKAPSPLGNGLDTDVTDIPQTSEASHHFSLFLIYKYLKQEF